eukprot:6281914-Lingulodinium_polyedra.AAC.1
MLNIADTTLKNKLRRDFDDDGHRAWEYIEQLHAVKDNDTRTTKAADERKSLVEEGMPAATESAARTFVEKLLEFN